MSNLSFSLLALGLCYQVLGEWDKSEQCHKEALSISQKTNSFQLIAGSYGSLGWLYYDKEQYVKAREYLEKAYEVCEEAGAKSLQNRILHCLCGRI